MTFQQAYRYPPLPSQTEPSLAERLNEAKKLRGQVSEGKFCHIIRAIHESARLFGDINANIGRRKPSVVAAPPIADIQAIVAEYFGLTIDELLSHKRTKHLIRARHIAMYLCRSLTTRSITEISRRFGRSDHSTVCYVLQKIGKLIKVDNSIAHDVEELKKLVIS